MSYRDKIHSGSAMSAAEITVWKELVRRGIRGDAAHLICLRWTVPDFYFQFSDVRHGYDSLAVYLDGEQVHTDLDKDEAITRQLQARHIKVLRYRYTPPLSQILLKTIVDEIEEVLRK